MDYEDAANTLANVMSSLGEQWDGTVDAITCFTDDRDAKAFLALCYTSGEFPNHLLYWEESAPGLLVKLGHWSDYNRADATKAFTEELLKRFDQ